VIWTNIGSSCNVSTILLNQPTEIVILVTFSWIWLQQILLYEITTMHIDTLRSFIPMQARLEARLKGLLYFC